MDPVGYRLENVRTRGNLALTDEHYVADGVENFIFVYKSSEEMRLPPLHVMRVARERRQYLPLASTSPTQCHTTRKGSYKVLKRLRFAS